MNVQHFKMLFSCKHEITDTVATHHLPKYCQVHSTHIPSFQCKSMTWRLSLCCQATTENKTKKLIKY